MAKYLGFLRKMISSKEDSLVDPNYARVQCFKVLTSFWEYDQEQFEKMQQYSKEIIKTSPKNYLRVAFFSKGLVFTTLLHLVLTLEPEVLFHHFLSYYLTFDPAGSFRLTKPQWERGLNTLALPDKIGKGKMMKAVAHMGGKYLKAFEFLKSRDQEGLLNSELSERVFQSLAMEGTREGELVVDWKKYLPYVFAFFCHWEAQEMIERYQQIHDIIGLPRELQSSGQYEIQAEGQVSGLLAHFLPFVPLDSTRVASEPSALLDYELSLPFLTHRHISSALKAFQVSASLHITTPDIATICEKVKSDYPSKSLIWDDMNVDLRTLLPTLALDLSSACELRKVISKGNATKEAADYEQLAGQTAIRLDQLTDDRLVTALVAAMGSSEALIAGEETAELLCNLLCQVLPKHRVSVLQSVQEKVVDAFPAPQPRGQATAESAFVALREAIAEEIDALFAFFVEKYEQRQTVQQHLKSRLSRTSALSQPQHTLHNKLLADILNNPMLKETLFKQAVVQIAKAV